MDYTICDAAAVHLPQLAALERACFSMGYNYNGKLKSAEVLLKEDGSTQLIRRAETPEDYFRTFDCFDILKDMKHPK